MLTFEYLRTLKKEEFIQVIFEAFHKILKDVPTEEIGIFIDEVIEKHTDRNDNVKHQSDIILRLVGEMEKEYRTGKYKSIE